MKQRRIIFEKLHCVNLRSVGESVFWIGELLSDNEAALKDIVNTYVKAKAQEAEERQRFAEEELRKKCIGKARIGYMVSCHSDNSNRFYRVEEDYIVRKANNTEGYVGERGCVYAPHRTDANIPHIVEWLEVYKPAEVGK